METKKKLILFTGAALAVFSSGLLHANDLEKTTELKGSTLIIKKRKKTEPSDSGSHPKAESRDDQVNKGGESDCGGKDCDAQSGNASGSDQK